ncbi:MAG: diaminopimelate decarboxylase [Acidimicrobiaceae bacterium]|nr:diaminopimelate decarboxylase [Acidimicrobiaceae bacterium]MDE0516550.1 diaminopimelate decarboxylase [Acidimicrobiaceae bacterium]MDE0656048.1 diaminopimelate decarboxylase [Acidimicrobiaceae bacterium]MXZ95250.1 diaminopimelate decarboxylase [Acidimicrobiaceae bacterium]MYF43754.1 diaminopimelate decarboxylase [Acidimicrobiaceae bacterium]
MAGSQAPSPAQASPLPRRLLPDNHDVSQGRLSIGGCDVLELADTYGTPLFVYDEEHLRSRCREAVAAFGPGVAYAAKAFLCVAMARLVHSEGMGLDVATGGELHVALAAGVPADRLVLHGNNKSMGELREAVAAGVGRIVVDSFDELDRLDGLHAETGARPKVLLRFTPGVEAHTHAYLVTGADDSKFGFTVSTGAAAAAMERARASVSVEVVGIHSHIGSQVFEASSFAKAVAVIAEAAAPFEVDEISVGGGLGVPYVAGESAPTIAQWGAAVSEACRSAGVTARVTAEPGRAIVAAAAVTLYTVGTIKTIEGVRTYAAVDGGISDNPRPVLYGSGYEAFLPRSVDAPRNRVVTVVGKHCESGDTLVRDAMVPSDMAVGDILATPVTGAYGHSMGSNYNKVLRPAVVFAIGGEARLVVRRETYDDLLACELPDA